MSDDFSGRVFGGYELRRIIGEGGMGTVYQAYQVSLQRDVALKVLSRTLDADERSRMRFLAEAKIAASLEHPHIVPVHDYGTQDGISFMSMRWLTGGSLDKVASRYKSPENIATLLEQLASALDYTHKQGIIHRDIKTANVLFDKRDVPYLTDFGIAKVLAETSALTTTGHFIGTPSYMAPELWHNEPASPASDIYALGILLFTLLAGGPPFQAASTPALMLMHFKDPPLLPTSLTKTAPQVKTVIDCALAKEADDRYQSAGAFARAFREALQVKLPSTDTTPPNPTSSPTAPITPVDSFAVSDNPTVLITGTSQLKAAPRSKSNRSKIWIPLLLPFLLIAGYLLLLLVRENPPSTNALTETAQSSASSPAIALASLGSLTASAVPTQTPTDTQRPSPTFTMTTTSTSTPTVTASSTPTATPSSTLTASATASSTPTATPSPTFTASATLTPLPSPTASPSPFVGPVTPASQSYDGQLTSEHLTISQPFYWQAGEVVTICLSSRDFDAYLRLKDTTGKALTWSDDYKGTKNACIINFIIPSTGIYTVVMSSFKRNETGSYQLQVISLADCAKTLPIAHVTRKGEFNLRSGPSAKSEFIRNVFANECFPIIGRNANSTWWKIRTGDGQEGWVMNGLVEIIGDTQSLPILTK